MFCVEGPVLARSSICVRVRGFFFGVSMTVTTLHYAQGAREAALLGDGYLLAGGSNVGVPCQQRRGKAASVLIYRRCSEVRCHKSAAAESPTASINSNKVKRCAGTDRAGSGVRKFMRHLCLSVPRWFK